MYWTRENILKTNASKRIIAKLKYVLSIPVFGKSSEEFVVLIAFAVFDVWLTEFKLFEELFVILFDVELLETVLSVELSVLLFVTEFSLAFVVFLAVIELAKEKLAKEIQQKLKLFLCFSL